MGRRDHRRRSLYEPTFLSALHQRGCADCNLTQTTSQTKKLSVLVSVITFKRIIHRHILWYLCLHFRLQYARRRLCKRSSTTLSANFFQGHNTEKSAPTSHWLSVEAGLACSGLGEARDAITLHDWSSGLQHEAAADSIPLFSGCISNSFLSTRRLGRNLTCLFETVLLGLPMSSALRI